MYIYEFKYIIISECLGMTIVNEEVPFLSSRLPV